MSENLESIKVSKKFNSILAILNDKRSNLPITSDELQNSQSIHSFMEKKINNYASMVEEILGSQEPLIVKKLNESKDKIQECISEALFKSESLSWNIFCHYYDIIKLDLRELSYLCDFLLEIFSKTVKRPYPIRTLYRGRRSGDIFNEINDPMDLFHIPFQNRFRSKNYRYTKAGHPGLYLGESAYICWAELGYFDLNQFALASFSFFKEDFKFLDISWRPIEISKAIELKSNVISKYRPEENRYEWCNSHYENLLSYILCIPLMMMCSIEISNENKKRTFIPEYIIPQFLFRYISEFKEAYFQGIKYFSMCRKFENLGSREWDDYSFDLLSKNYVIVIPDYSGKGYSTELRKKIKISKPISYQGLIVDQDQNGFGDSYGWENAGASKISGLTSKNYNKNIFGIMEFILHKTDSLIFKGKKFLFEGIVSIKDIKLEWFLKVSQNSGKIIQKIEDDPDYIIKKEKTEENTQRQIKKPIIMDHVEFRTKLEASIIDGKNKFNINS